MTTKTEVCNLALARIGKPATTNIDTENSTEAKYSRRFWDVARQATLRVHDWNFATRRRTLALLDQELDDWTYVYAYPNDCLKVQCIVNPAGRNLPPIKYKIMVIDGDKVIATDQENAVLEYTFDEENPALFDSEFVEMMGWRLAMDLAGPLTRDAKLVQSCTTMFINYRIEAKSRDAAEGQKDEPADAPWVQAQLGADTSTLVTINTD